MIKASNRGVVLLRLKPSEKLGCGKERRGGDACFYGSVKAELVQRCLRNAALHLSILWL